MKIKIRKIEISDIPEVLKIEQVSFSEPWPEKAFQEEINNHEMFGLFYEEMLVAYISGWKILDEYNITNLAVREDLRKMGSGNLLVSHVLLLHKEDCTHFYLEVRESNLSARELYEKKNFTVTGIRKDYYSKPKENAIIMEYRLPNEVI
jgi:[ribosomal protein S18]-alanine N-acetyltransferase